MKCGVWCNSMPIGRILKPLAQSVGNECRISIVAVGSDKSKPFTHASSPLLGFLQGAVVSGFFAFYGIRQGALADGLHGLNPRNTEAPNYVRGTWPRGATPSTWPGGFNSRAWGRLKAARRDTAQVNLPLFTPYGVGGGFAVNLYSGPLFCINQNLLVTPGLTGMPDFGPGAFTVGAAGAAGSAGFLGTTPPSMGMYFPSIKW